MKRLLIRATNWVGDAVMSLPALHALRDGYPEAHIAILARPWVSDLYERESICDEVIPYTPVAGKGDWVSKWEVARRLAREHFDTAVLLPNSFESAIVAKLAGIPRIIGYNRDGRGLLLTDAIAVSKVHRHERFYYLELLKRAGLIEAFPADDGIRLTRASEVGAALLEARGISLPAIGVSPGAAYGNAKRWLPERFAEAAREVSAALGAQVVLFGSAGERELCETVAGGIGTHAHNHVHNLAGQTSLREFIDMAAACRIFLTNDSGAMHVASALGIPSVTVFGSTDDVTTGPTGALARVVREAVDCSPCLLRECPIDHRCMTRIPAERVTDTAFELLRCGSPQ